MRTLACIAKYQPNHASIFVHEIINRVGTPELVIRHIMIHEIIHLLVPGRKYRGEWTSHPPEFWDMERELSIESKLAWRWVWANFRTVLTEDKKKEEIRVSRSWKRQYIQDLIPTSDIADGNE
jgi:hypothetical protein